MKDVECKEVIITRMTRRGKGVEGDPVRVILQVWDKEGNLIAENDPQIESEKYRRAYDIISDFNVGKQNIE